jgi:hypothetical protein
MIGIVAQLSGNVGLAWWEKWKKQDSRISSTSKQQVALYSQKKLLLVFFQLMYTIEDQMAL